MVDFWINGVGGIIITVLAFVVGLSLKKKHPVIAELFIIFAFCWVFLPLFSIEPSSICHGCVCTGYYKLDVVESIKSVLTLCIPLISFIVSAKKNKMFFDDDPKAITEDDFDDGL